MNMSQLLEHAGKGAAHLDHEVADAAVKARLVVVAHFTEREEVLARARREVTVQLQVERALHRQQLQVRLLLWVPALATRRIRRSCRVVHRHSVIERTKMQVNKQGCSLFTHWW